MIPVSLTIKGLYSYQEETTIDFTNLTAAGLFGIFGAVGSGKSTILEAISFALYGETERLNKLDKRSYNMMNLRSKIFFINFIFTCGDCDHKYKFTVSARRSSKNFNDGGKIERLAYIWDDNWIPTSSDAEKILGLSYDNFKRTIIIPQGKFQEFLQLKEGERVQMLKEIFSLEKFELGPKVSKLSKENEIRISNLQGQMQSLPLHDHELLKDKDEQIFFLNKKVINQTNNFKIKQEEEKALQDIKGLFADVNAKIIALNTLQSKQNSIDNLDLQIKQFEQCEQVFKYPIENRNRLQQSIKNQQIETKELQVNQTSFETTIKTESAKADKLKDSYTNRELLLQKASELEKIILIKPLQEIIFKLTARIEKGSIIVKNEEKNLEAVKEQLLTVKSAITSAEQSLPDAALLVTISNWFNNKTQLQTNLVKAEQELSEAAGRASKAEADIKIKLAQLPTEIKLAGFPASLAIVKDETDRVNKEYDEQLQVLNNNQSHLKLSQKLDEFAKSLTEDSECPLCGATHHPKVFSALSVTEDLVQKQATIEELNSQKQLLNNILINLSGIYSNYETYSAQFNQKQQELNKQKNDLNNCINSFPFAGYSVEDEPLVRKQLAEIEQKNSEIKKLRKQRDDKDKELDEAGKKIATYKAGIEKFKTERAQHEGQSETLKNQVLLHVLEVETIKPVTELTNSASAFKVAHVQVTKEFEQAQKALQDNTNHLSALNGRLQELQKQISVNIDQKEGLDKQIAGLLAAEGYQTEQQVEQVLSTKLDIKQEKNNVEIFRQQLHTASVQLQEASGKVEGKEYSEQSHETLKTTLAALSKELADNTEMLVTERYELQELKQHMQMRSELQKDLDKLTVRAENLKVLGNLFRTGGFVNYVSSVYLQNLLNSANQRFYKMTRQKLMLELAEDNSFMVRDFMNNGEVRSVKTLSGGRTFQAALSLALALADNIQHLTKSKQNFFFLDEGFGSLDK